MPQGDIQDEGPCFFFPFDPCLFWWPEVFRFDVAKPRADRSSFMFGTRDFPGNMIGSLPNMILDSPRMPGLKWKIVVIVLVYSCVEFGTSQYMITSESIPPRLQLSFVFVPNFGKDFEWFWFWRASFNKGCLKPPRELQKNGAWKTHAVRAPPGKRTAGMQESMLVQPYIDILIVRFQPLVFWGD